MNGKGDKTRVTNFNAFKANFEKIDWSVKKQQEDAKVMAEDFIPFKWKSSNRTDMSSSSLPSDLCSNS
jgi:hypothetical protein